MPGTKSFSTSSLITVPALLTLAITIVRLVGELKHWPAPWFSNAAGGGGALVGISWLPILFGHQHNDQHRDAGGKGVSKQHIHQRTPAAAGYKRCCQH